tara:strand:+ start:765 stop:3092 length:2328 start_codon:yes stop_codon:yes gene_type:complete
MESLLIYLLKSAGLLSLFYILYILLLKNDTAFTANRKFLLGGIVGSAILPAIYFTKTVIVNAPVFSYSQFSNSEIVSVQETKVTTDWWQIIGILYLAISGFFFLQLLFRSALIYRTIIKNTSYKNSKYTIVETSQTSGPYSFFNYIFINSKSAQKEEFDLMLHHEKVHADQYHSADMLLANLLTSVLWFNPLSWFYKKIIAQNLEYIADYETANKLECIQHYQHVLVKVSTNTHQPALVNNFYQSFIKKRIVMLNKKTTSSRNAWKYQLILPLIAIFIMSFNVKTTTKLIESKAAKISEPVLQNESLSVGINQSTSKESLEKFKKIFLKWDVELSFSNIEYSADGKIITAIEVKFKNLKTKETGALNRTDSNGIAPFKIYVNKNGSTGFKEITSEKSNFKNATLKLKDINENPLYIINNKEYSTADLDGKTIIYTEIAEILDPKVATERFGAKAIDGAIIISKGKIVDDYKSELKLIDKENLDIEMSFIEVKKNSKPMFVHLETSKSDSSKNAGNAGSPWKISSDVVAVAFETDTPSENAEQIKTAQAQGDPLIFIDGKMQNKRTNITDIDPDDIARISIVSGKDPVKIYGKKAKDGLVLITTKKAGNKMSRFSVGTGVQMIDNDKYSNNDNSNWAEKAIGKRDYYPLGNVTSSTTIITRKDTIVNKGTSNGNLFRIISNDSVKTENNYKIIKLDSTININAANIPNSTSFYFTSGDKHPLIIIDGKMQKEDFNPDEIDPSAIKSIKVLKDKSATNKYGKKGKNGVVEITLKEKK